MSSNATEPFFVEIDAASPAVEVSPPQAAPEWFKKKKPTPAPAPAKPVVARRVAKRPAKLVIPAKSEEETEELPWQERWKLWVLGAGGAGYGMSMLLHAAILIIFSLIIFIEKQEEVHVTTLVQPTEADIVELEPLDTEFDMLPEEPQIENPLLPPAPDLAADVPLDLTGQSITGDGLGPDNDAPGGGLKFEMPSRVFSKGSFTVWTEPNDPKPGQTYQIVIQVQLKADAKRLSRRDLSGNVVGTDGYRQKFGNERGYHKVVNRQVQMEVTVPGAAQLVEDTIEVKSKSLKEEQTITIVF